MFVPNVGQRVKLKTLGFYSILGVTPNWQWLRVDEVVVSPGKINYGVAKVTVLDGDRPTDVTGIVELATINPPLGWREAKPGEYLFTIATEKVEMVRDWFKNRGGVLRWTNKDLGNCCAPDKLTPALPEPGETKQAPGWAYVGDSFPVKPEEIGVRTETAVELPPEWFEWFPVCDRCDGTGRVSVASLAKIRKETQEATLAALKSDGRTTLIDAKSIKCWACDGTGRKERYIQVRVKKAPWIGYDLYDAGKDTARSIAKKLGPDVKWGFECIGYGLARLRFFREKIEPFTL